MYSKNWIESLPEEICAAVKSRMGDLTLTDGEAVYHRGDYSTEQYLIISGEVRITLNSWDGREMLCINFQPGDSFGETSALDSGVRPHDAIAHGATQLSVLRQKDMNELRVQYPQIETALVSFLCGRSRMLFAISADATLLDLPNHMASRLVALLDQYSDSSQGRVQQDLKLTHQELAQMMGASRQGVSKILKQWEAQGLIEISYGYISLRDTEGLKILAEQY